MSLIKHKLLFSMLLFVLAGTNSSTAAEIEEPLVSDQILKDIQLEVSWKGFLPMVEGEKLDRLLILDNYLYAISDRDFTLSVDRTDGRIIFYNTIKPANLRVVNLTLYEDELLSSSGSIIAKINPADGGVRSFINVGFGISSPAVRNSSFIYINGSDKRIHALNAENMVESFTAAAISGSRITSVIADEDCAVFSTKAGDLICMHTDTSERLWEFTACEAINGPLVRTLNSLFFSCQDTYVYRIDFFTYPEPKELIWKCQMGGLLKKAPRVTETTVYQPVFGKGITAIGKESGQILWSLPEALDLLAEANNKAYMIIKDNKLVVMDNIKMKKLFSINFSNVTKYAPNTIDSKIYIADTTGRIACLEPTG